MDGGTALIGFGEAASAFVGGRGLRAARLIAYDVKTESDATAAAKRGDYAAVGVVGAASPAEAVAGATQVLSLVTADQALAAAEAAAPHLAAGALWFEMNSVAPESKRAVARTIGAAGGRAVDVAVMAPVHPARAGVPLLVSGPHAREGARALGELGFANVTVVPGEIGRASSVKMIRSVMVKGIEALTAECLLAASRAGVLDEVLASLDASPPPPGWPARADYNLDRMIVHGLRRAAEMEEAVKTLEALGVDAAMTRGTVERQRSIGDMALVAPDGLAAKIEAVLADAASSPRARAA